MHFSAVGTFSHKFSIAHSSETTNRNKKVRGCKNGTDLLYPQAKCSGEGGSHDGCRRKSVMFLFLTVCFLLRFEMTNFMITETL